MEVSTDAGATWNIIWSQVGVDLRATTEQADMSTYSNHQANVWVRFRSVQPGWDWWWTIDNVEVCLSGSGTTTFQLTVNVTNGWNMVSIPGLHPTDQNVNTWWAFRDPGANVFKYAGGYQAVATATPGLDTG